MWQWKRWPKLLIGVVCLVLSSVSPARAAEQPSAPLILAVSANRGPYFESEYYAWTGADQPLKNLTNYGWNGSPILSPDNRYIAYLSMPEALKKAMVEDPNYGAAGVYPADVSLLDLTTGAWTQIAAQPTDLSADDCLWKCWHRSPPSWSPDSTLLAWTEAPADNSAGSLMVYDIATKTSRAIASNLTISDQYLNRVYWGETGLALWEYADKDDLKVYTVDGQILFTTTLTGNGKLQWVKDGEHDYLRVDAEWGSAMEDSPFFLDTVTGQRQPAQQQELELYSLSAPDGASVLATADQRWQVRLHGQAPLDLPLVDETREGYAGLMYNVAISPDGRQVAYADHWSVVIYANGQTIKVPLADKMEVFGVAWGAMGWRVAQTAP